MFDKEIVKKELEEIYKNNASAEDIDFDTVVGAYEVVDGFYVFRVYDDAYFFTDNLLIDCCPGYFLVVD